MIDAPKAPHNGGAHRFTLPLFLTAVAAVPVAYIIVQIAAACHNIAFWDEYDSVLAPLLQIDAGMNWREFVGWLFRLENEHRTATSRLIFAASYGLSGGVNFDIISVLGNFALFGLCATLIAAVRPWERRVRLGVLLAFGLFHLEHYEPFLWSGASIDHFLVLALAGGAVVAIAREGRLAWVAGAMCAVLATYSLAHGCVVWLIGAAMLWSAKRQRRLFAWCALAGLNLALFSHGFEIHASHHIRDFSPAGLGRLTQFWLALLGGPLTFGARSPAPLFGMVLVVALSWLGWRGAWRREPVLMPFTLFTVVSLALVAFGRYEVASSQIQSRYLILGSLAWTLTVFMVLEQWTMPTHPFGLLAGCLPVLALFNVAANIASAQDAETFAFSRVYPAIRFEQYGEEGHAAPFRLHPERDTAKRILAQAAARGIYRLPRFCDQSKVPEPVFNPQMVTYITDLTADQHAVGFEGWAMFPQRKSKSGQIYVVLRSDAQTLVFKAFGVARPDVAKAFHEPLWRDCGYSFVVARNLLPTGNYQIGLLITDGKSAELKMTEHWLNLGISQHS